MSLEIPPPAAFPRGSGFEGLDPPQVSGVEIALLVPLLRLDVALRSHEARLRRSAPVRVLRGVAAHFRLRVAEWFTTALLLQFGLILFGPGDVFPHSPNLSVMAQWASEETWGALCLGVGGVHLLALTINGTFPAFPFSPHVRAAASFLACFLWFQITLAIFMSGIGGTGLGTYRLVLALEIWNFVRASLDAGRAEGRRVGNVR